MKKQNTIAVKLMGSFAGFVAIMLLLSYTSLNSIGNLSDELQLATNSVGKKMEMAAQIGAETAQMRISQRGVILFALLKDPSKSDESVAQFQAAASRLDGLLTKIKPMLTLERGRRAVADIEIRLATSRSLNDQIHTLSASQTLTEGLNQAIGAAVSNNNGIDSDVTDLIQIQQGLFAGASSDGLSIASTARWTTAIIILLCMGVAAIVWFVVRQISGKLRVAVGELSDSAQQVAGAAKQVASSSQALAQGASEQAASLEETSASSEEINSMAHKNTENSRSAADLVTHSRQQFVQANQSLEQMVTAMGEIKTSSDKISKIIKTIDEIAFQTNILALNAAVEAARAGEAGMGFAVVADEVRNLAQRSAQAAKDTAALIEESITRSNEGKAKVDQVATAIRTITGETDKVNTLVDEVNLGSQEQTRGIEQVAKAIAQMDQMTQRNAASAEESASAAEQLTAQSQAMMDVVTQLSAMVGQGSVQESSLLRGRPVLQPVRELQPVRATRHEANPDEAFPMD